jgi:tetratricopeptide (TPR) repeat protein
VISILLILSSCAGLGVQSPAQSAFEQGLALFNQGKYEEAIPHFTRATELDANFARAYLYLGRSYLNVRKWVEAIPPLRTAFRLSPDEVKKETFNVLLDALFGAAVAELNKGNFPSSISFFKEILVLDPRSGKAKNELVGALVLYGGALLSEGKVAEAVKVFTEATELSPQNFDAYLGLTKAFIEHGDMLRALLAIGNAIGINPTNPEAQSLFQQLQGR